MRSTRSVFLAILLLALLLTGCRNETQNRIRRSIQDFTNVRMYITVYSLDGTMLFEGQVDGKVTRASANLEGTNETASGAYIFWYDERGRYHQTDLPYLLSTYDRDEE
jgi:uncharacterized protein YcfL